MYRIGINILLCRYLKFCHRSLNFVSDKLNTLTICPACPRVSSLLTAHYYNNILNLWQKNGTLFESFDALFSLCRKKAAGQSVRPPLYGTLYFDDQDVVDDFISTYDLESSVSSKVCTKHLLLIVGILSINVDTDLRAAMNSLLVMSCGQVHGTKHWMKLPSLVELVGMNFQSSSSI